MTLRERYKKETGEDSRLWITDRYGSRFDYPSEKYVEWLEKIIEAKEKAFDWNNSDYDHNAVYTAHIEPPTTERRQKIKDVLSTCKPVTWKELQEMKENNNLTELNTENNQ